MLRVLLIAFLLGHACDAQAEIEPPAFPKGAVILETQKIVSAKHLNRTLILWMLNPKKHLGYREKHDRVMQYAVDVGVTDQSNSSTETLFWIDYLFTYKPQRLRYWKYEIDYRGRGGSLDKWEVKYDQSQERFQGTVVRIGGEP